MQNVRVAQLKAELARVERLVAGQNASAAEAEKARAELDGARAQAAAAAQRLAQADAALREARHQYSLTTITAPMDGIVTQRLKQVGERVRGSDFSEDVLMVISTLSKMEMKMEVGEHEVVYVKEGDAAEIEIDAFPDRKFKAQVVEVARNATIKNAGTEQEVTTFVVRLALVDQVTGALPGMSAQASVSTDTRAGAVVVPIQAVTVRSEKELASPGGVAGEGRRRSRPRPPARRPGRRSCRRSSSWSSTARPRCARSRPGWPPTPRSRSSPGVKRGRAWWWRGRTASSPATSPTARRSRSRSRPSKKGADADKGKAKAP